MNPLLPKTILVGTDFSEHADRALDLAIAIAQAANAKVVVLYACPLPVVGLPEGALVATQDIVLEMQAEARRRLDDLLKRRQGSLVLLTSRVEAGDPREVLVTVADEIHADLIVLGTHGRRGFRRALLGSVAESVVRTAACPVLVARAPSSAGAERAA